MKYEELVNLIEQYPSRLTRFDAVLLLVDSKGSVGHNDARNIMRLWLDGLVD